MENFNELNQITENKLPNTNLFQRFLYCWKNSFAYAGRANRAEFWGFVLFSFLVAIIPPPIIGLIYSVVALFPFLAVLSRRFHDTGQNFLFILIPLTIGIAGLIGTLGLVWGLGTAVGDGRTSNETEILAILFAIIMMILPIILKINIFIAVAAGIWAFIISVKSGTKGSNKYGGIPK